MFVIFLRLFFHPSASTTSWDVSSGVELFPRSGASRCRGNASQQDGAHAKKKKAAVFWIIVLLLRWSLDSVRHVSLIPASVWATVKVKTGSRGPSDSLLVHNRLKHHCTSVFFFFFCLHHNCVHRSKYINLLSFTSKATFRNVSNKTTAVSHKRQEPVHCFYCCIGKTCRFLQSPPTEG